MNNFESIDYPFSADVDMNCESSSYTLHIEKSAANLLSVSVVYPESLYGLTLSADEFETIGFDSIASEVIAPMSVIKLISASFNSINVIRVQYYDEVTTVNSKTPYGNSKLVFDSFSSAPISLEAGNIIMKFSDYSVKGV